MKYYIFTYGCQMNVHESEKIAGMLKSLGYNETENYLDADVIVFNTCCIRKAAEQKAEGNIGALKSLKKKKPNLIVAVGGCMTQQTGRAQEIKKMFPFVNIIFGTHNLYMFREYLENYLKSKKSVIEVWDKDNVLPIETDSFRTSGYNAWVNISYGCNNFCTYCIVPYVRGRERSRDFNEIVCECKSLIEKGYKTITLLGQNVNSYGNDVEDSSVNFANLLQTIASLPGDFVLKFMTSHPKDLTDDVIMTIANNPKISRNIHLPVQSGSNNILKSMNRKYTIEHYLERINKIRECIPNCALSTDLIVGFPGETEEDFNKTVELIKKVKYNSVFAFMYSKRSGTVAERMENQVADDVKNERVNFILSVQKEVAKQALSEMVGKVYRVFVNEIKGGGYIGETDCGKTIIITNYNGDLQQFVSCKIVEVKDNQVFGEMLNE